MASSEPLPHLLRYFNTFLSLILQAGSPRTPRSPKSQRMEDSASGDIFGKSLVSPTNVEPALSSNPPPLSGVDGDIKEAFGDRSSGRNLRDDLLLAADNVTSAMSSLVKELNSGMMPLLFLRPVARLLQASDACKLRFVTSAREVRLSADCCAAVTLFPLLRCMTAK